MMTMIPAKAQGFESGAEFGGDVPVRGIENGVARCRSFFRAGPCGRGTVAAVFEEQPGESGFVRSGHLASLIERVIIAEVGADDLGIVLDGFRRAAGQQSVRSRAR